MENTKLETTGRKHIDTIAIDIKKLKLRCDLNGEYRIGNNWAETH